MNLSNTLLEALSPCLPKHFITRIVRGSFPEFQANPDGVTFRKARSVEDYMSCFRLLHDVYVEAGFIQPSIPPLRIIPHHSDPGSMVLMGCRTNDQGENTSIYTASLFPDGKQGLPMDTGFKQQVDELRNKGRRLVEVGCLALHPLYRKKDQNIFMLGNRMILSHAMNTFHADDLFIVVHPKYLKIYEDLFLFEKVGLISSYSNGNKNPVVALRQNLDSFPQRLKDVYAKTPIEKNLYRFLFESESTSNGLPLDVEKKRAGKYYGSDKKDLVIDAYSAALQASMGLPSYNTVTSSLSTHDFYF